MGGKDCNTVFLGAVVILAVGVLLKSLLVLRTKGCPPLQRPLSDGSSSAQSSPSTPSSSPSTVPFVFLRDASYGQKPIGKILQSVVQSYQKENSQALYGLSTMLDQAIDAEANGRGRLQKNWNNRKNKPKLLSAKIERRIQRTAACLEHDERILVKLLGNFSYVLALPDVEVYGNDVDENSTEIIEEETLPTGKNTKYRLPERKKKAMNESETHSYDSATQIWAHLVRDWTIEGRTIRHIIYDWCHQQMEIYCQKTNATVLVPGAGMGRLAYDLYQKGYNVEANELSPSMAAAASSVLRNQIGGNFHPYVLDGMANEVDSERRFDSVHFPDIPIQTIVSTSGDNDPSLDNCVDCGSLSYTVGNFVGNDDFYYSRQRVGQFDTVVTCFFIDTATNIYEYLETIHELLRPGIGVWINVGPVQWHHNAVLRPSVDELKDLIEASGWNIQVWSIDSAPVSYRDESGSHFLPRSTSYNGYHPLRFVATPSR